MSKIKFHSQKIEEDLLNHGYSIVNFSNKHELEELKIKSAELNNFRINDMMFGNLQDTEYVTKSKQLLYSFLKQKIESYGFNISIIEPTFAIKPPNFGWFGNHQDWNNINEDNARTFSFWIPLQDVDKNNGCFSVLGGSHNFETSYRSATTSWKYNDSEYKQIIDSKKTTIPLELGQALLFDSKLIHSTHPNTTKENRTAIIIGIKPKDEKMLHYYQPKDSNCLEVFEIDSEFFNNYDYKSRPTNYKSLGFIKNKNIPLTPLELKEKINEYEAKNS